MTVINKQIKDAIEQGVVNATAQGVPVWLGATDALLELFVGNRECFSSGEIAAHIRTYRPDIKFSVTTNIGEHVRDRFYAASMPLYLNTDGSHSPVEMVPRTTGGFTRTPPGTQVLVYGPSFTDATAHAFEIEIPQPGVVTPGNPLDTYGLPTRPVQAPVANFVNLTPRQVTIELRATVHTDARCCVPRSAFEALLHETQTGLKGGESVYVKVDANEAVVSLDRAPGSQGYQLTATRGRILFPHPAHPFKPGDAYKVTVDGGGRRLVVDLTVPV